MVRLATFSSLRPHGEERRAATRLEPWQPARWPPSSFETRPLGAPQDEDGTNASCAASLHLCAQTPAHLGAGHDLALDRARMAAELGNHEAFLARDGDVVDAGAAHALALGCARDETVAEARGIEERDRAMLGDGALVVGLAGEREGG